MTGRSLLRSKQIGRSLAVAAALLMADGAARAEVTVELELLLAVDASSSVDDQEFELQMRGLAGAFRHPAVLAAIQAAGAPGLAIALMQWSGGGKQVLAVPWTRVDGNEGAARLAETIDRTPRLIVGGDTSLRGAIRFGTRQFDGNGLDGLRRVLDLSGDGGAVGSQFAKPNPARDEAVAQGITINGLAILNEVPDLDRYYRNNVIGGAGAFVATADDYEDFAIAIVAKLIREIESRPIADAKPVEIGGNPAQALALIE